MGFVKISTFHVRPEAVLYVVEGAYMEFPADPESKTTATVILDTQDGLQSITVEGPTADQIVKMIEVAERSDVRPFRAGALPPGPLGTGRPPGHSNG